jgi:hypothetical protein
VATGSWSRERFVMITTTSRATAATRSAISSRNASSSPALRPDGRLRPSRRGGAARLRQHRHG